MKTGQLHAKGKKRERETTLLFHTIHKSQLWMYYEAKYEKQTYKTFRKFINNMGAYV